MRTRSQGPEPNEDPDTGSALSLTRRADGQKLKKKEGRDLSVDVEEASTRTSFETPSPARAFNVDIGRLNPSTDQAISAAEKEQGPATMARPTSSAAANSPAHPPRRRLRNPWLCSPLTLTVTILASLLAYTIFYSFTIRQLDPKGCAMSYMRSAYAAFPDFDTEHTRFASKYSLYLYRELGVDEDTRVG